MNNKDIVKAYKNIRSIEAVSRKFGISSAKAKKILVTEGAYENATSKRVRELYEAGKSTQEIAGVLEVGKSCVNMYIPYKKGVYGSDNPTDNAMRIRKCRKKKSCLDKR